MYLNWNYSTVQIIVQNWMSFSCSKLNTNNTTENEKKTTPNRHHRLFGSINHTPNTKLIHSFSFSLSESSLFLSLRAFILFGTQMQIQQSSVWITLVQRMRTNAATMNIFSPMCSIKLSEQSIFFLVLFSDKYEYGYALWFFAI